jgi:hypothetical protein
MGARGSGEGFIYQRASDGRWLCVLTIGYSSDAMTIRKSLIATTRIEALTSFTFVLQS